jgi:DNA repair exonuclease SbcCD ATPase subunit
MISGGSHPLDEREIEQLKLQLSEAEADRQSLQQRLDEAERGLAASDRDLNALARESKAEAERLNAQLRERRRDYAVSLEQMSAALAAATRLADRDKRVLDAAEAWRDWFPHVDSMFIPENALIGAVDARRALDDPEITITQPMPPPSDG